MPPRSAGKVGCKNLAQLSNDPRTTLPKHQRPTRGGINGERLGCRRMTRVDTGEARTRCGSTALVQHVDHCEGQIAGIGRDRKRAASTGALPRSRGRRLGGELTQKSELALADYALRIVRIGAKNTAYRLVVSDNGAV